MQLPSEFSPFIEKKCFFAQWLGGLPLPHPTPLVVRPLKEPLFYVCLPLVTPHNTITEYPTAPNWFKRKQLQLGLYVNSLTSSMNRWINPLSKLTICLLRRKIVNKSVIVLIQFNPGEGCKLNFNILRFLINLFLFIKYQRHPFSNVASSTGNQQPTRDMGSLQRKVLSWWGITSAPSQKSNSILWGSHLFGYTYKQTVPSAKVFFINLVFERKKNCEGNFVLQ